jgi:hypothetical protein
LSVAIRDICHYRASRPTSVFASHLNFIGAAHLSPNRGCGCRRYADRHTLTRCFSRRQPLLKFLLRTLESGVGCQVDPFVRILPAVVQLLATVVIADVAVGSNYSCGTGIIPEQSTKALPAFNAIDRATSLSLLGEQQDVSLPLMRTLGMKMRNVLVERAL